MKGIIFALKRTSFSFILLLILTLLLVAITPLFDTPSERSEAGFVCLCDSIEGQGIEEYLIDNGFVRFDDVNSMKKALDEQKLQCAFVIPPELTSLMERGDMQGVIKMYQSDVALRPEMWRQHVAAAVYSEYAPYLSMRALNGTDITLDEVKDKYEELSKEGYSFVFSFEKISEEQVYTASVSSRMLMFVLSLFVFLISGYEIAIPTVRDSEAMFVRIGKKKTLLHFSIPFFVVRYLMLALSLALGTALIGRIDLIAPSILYSLLVILFALLLSAVMGKYFTSAFSVVGTLSCFAIPLICPIVFDAALFFPYIEYARYAFVPYWLWYLI